MGGSMTDAEFSVSPVMFKTGVRMTASGTGTGFSMYLGKLKTVRFRRAQTITAAIVFSGYLVTSVLANPPPADKPVVAYGTLTNSGCPDSFDQLAGAFTKAS